MEVFFLTLAVFAVCYVCGLLTVWLLKEKGTINIIPTLVAVAVMYIAIVLLQDWMTNPIFLGGLVFYMLPFVFTCYRTALSRPQEQQPPPAIHP